MEGLYSEIVYSVVNYVGKDAETVRLSVLKYLQDVFQVNNNKHEKLVQVARDKQKPQIYLNVSIVEATLRKPTDINGMSDPFCVLYLASRPLERCTSSIQFETLNPVWNESFQFEVEDPIADVLCLEIWDFDEEQTVSEKLQKLKEVKTVRGLKVYWKEVKHAVASTRNSISSCNELVGSTLIPLKDIPISGITMTCRLDKNSKVKKQGDVKIHVSFSLKSDAKTAFEQYRHLLYNILLQELKSTKNEFYKWSGGLSSVPQAVLEQFESQCNISPLHVSLAKWIEHIHVHEHHPLKLRLFLPLLENLVTPLEDNDLNMEQKLLFWEAVTKLLPSCMMAIRRIQMLSQGRRTVTDPIEIISLVSQLAKISRPPNIDLFPKSKYSWLTENETYTIQTAVAETIFVGAKEWFTQTLEANNILGTTDDDEKLNCPIEIIDLTKASLHNTLDHYEETFRKSFHFSYAEILYKVYEANVMEMVEPILADVCKSMKPIKFNDNSEEAIYDNDPLTVGSKLFLLYKKLREFAKFGSQLCAGSMDLLLPNKFHEWFNPALVQWLYIISYKAKHQIQNAVKLDNSDNALQTTTSAVDLFGIYEEIKIFWNDLEWPEPKTRCLLLTRLIDEICDCLNFYVLLMVKRGKLLIDNDPRIANQFKITVEWCLIVKNIRHTQNLVPKFVEDFKLDEVTSETCMHTTFSPEDWRLQILTLMHKCIEECNEKVEEMMNTVVEKLRITACKLFLSKLTNNKVSSVDETLAYLDENLFILNQNLETKDFQQITHIIWKDLCHAVYNLTASHMKTTRERSSFIRIQEFSEKLLELFSHIPVSKDYDMNKYSHLKRLLIMNSMKTDILIHEYYLEQLAKQKAMQDAKYGFITVRVQFLDDILRLEIVNGKHLQPICPRGQCDPYVKVRLLPEEKFANIPPYKTKVHNRTTSPIFGDKFTIELSKEQRNVHNGMLLFILKQVVMLGNNYLLGESLLSFDDIPSTSMFSNFDSMGKKQLNICRPMIEDSEVCSVLMQKEDKTARDFIRTRTNRYPQSR